jgi:LCP family protein required for cell wall assembly
MSTPQRARDRAPRSRSAFAAAFLSLLFPGLGHAYAGAFTRALGFAALPLLLIALLLGIALQGDIKEFLIRFADPGILTAIFVGNILALVYRIVAAVDAWQVARFLNAGDASGGGRLGRARLRIHPLSVAGLAAVVLVMGMGHLVVGRYDVMAMNLVNCVFSEDPSPDCEETADASETPGASDSVEPADSLDPSDSGLAVESPTDDVPSVNPSASGTLAPTLPPWNGKERLNILAIGSDARPGDGSSFNTDTMIVVSIDPQTKEVAMFQVPRDTVDVPVPSNAQALWGSVYGGRINSWYNQNRNRTDMWPGKSAEKRGMNALKAILGKLYGLDIRYYVKVDFQGFKDVVSTIGGVQINVQMPVYESLYPVAAGWMTRVYIPSGPQHMTGTEALMYARSRHRASGGDFDRGRRQQRVLVSLKEQMSVQAILANLDQLIKDVGRSVKTDIPVAQLPKLLALADGVDTKNIRSYVFSPPFYGANTIRSGAYIIEPNVPRIRNAVKDAFSTNPNLIAQRERLGIEGARVWVYNASGRTDLAAHNAEFLTFNGLDASAPVKKAGANRAKTEIKVYNGTEGEMPETVKFLEKVYKTKVVPVTDPSVTNVDFVITLGQDAPDKQVDSVG